MKDIISIMKDRSGEVQEVKTETIEDETKSEHQEISKNINEMNQSTTGIDKFVIGEDLVNVIIENLACFYKTQSFATSNYHQV